MGNSLAKKIIAAHLAEGEMKAGREIGLKIDQTLTQDATGTMAYLEFESMGLKRVQTELSVSYIDHNTLQTGFENADDHKFLQSVAAKYGIVFSRVGNGICHQVHLENFGKPGKTLLGSDSHTPTGGGLGMLAIGAGGLDVALAMAGQPFFLVMPEIVNIRLEGKLSPWVTAKDVILEVLRRFTVKGGLGKIFEYSGPGAATLSVPERATITNMGAELGATSSLFPSDARTYEFLKSQGREGDFVELLPDHDAEYDQVEVVKLDELEPLLALPHSPDNVMPVSRVQGKKVDQVFIGSCTNSSYTDLAKAAGIFKGKVVHPGVSLSIAPGSRKVFYNLAREGHLADLIASGARILESACGPCVGVGQAPSTGGVSLRTTNRNFEGRSGTNSAEVFLASVETCAASALVGCITDPRTLGAEIIVSEPASFTVDEGMILTPPEDGSKVEIFRGPNIKPLPVFEPLPDRIELEAVLKVGDNITTDHIMPAGAKILPFRSNIPEISKYVFANVDPEFYQRVKEKKGGIIIGGQNYGQGSSREHAALAPKYLGIGAIIAKNFARIHRQNLVNFGILPLTFVREGDYDSIRQGDVLLLENLREAVEKDLVIVKNLTQDTIYETKHGLSPRHIGFIMAGSILNTINKVK